VLQHYEHIFSAEAWPYWLFFLFSVVVICYLFFRREKRIKLATMREINRRQSMVNLEVHAFQAQMDPHFIFNSLNAIHHYILTTSTDMASLYLTRFSKLMRLMIANFNKDWVNLEDDVEALELYIQLEQLRFEPQFVYQLHLLPEVDHQFTLVPPLIIQPYVQQAIWHRILQRPQKTGGRLDVFIGRDQDRLFIQVEDNGVRNELQPASYAAAQLTRNVAIAAERLHIMSEKYHMQASVIEQDIYDERTQTSVSRTTISMQHITSRQLLAG
jgi:LytS/YehU family sensor histidine kinase